MKILKNEDNLKTKHKPIHEDNPVNKDGPKHEDKLKNDDLKNEDEPKDDLKNQCNLKNEDDLQTKSNIWLIFLWVRFPFKKFSLQLWYFQLCCIFLK